MYDCPEQGMQEKRSARMLEDWLETRGFSVGREFHGVETAFRAVYGIPYDGGVSFRSGASEAPEQLRNITYTISPTTEDFRDFSALKVKDIWAIVPAAGKKCSPRPRIWRPGLFRRASFL